MKQSPRIHAPLLLIGLLMGGCALGPKYEPPQLNIPADFKENAQWKVAQPAMLQPQDPWWAVYQDPVLNQLMDTLNQHNPSIAQAEAQYRQAQALLRQAQAGLFPTLGSNASRTKEQSKGAEASTTYNLGLNASWEVDLWGSVRQAIQAGKAQLQAEDATLAAAKLSAQVSLANAYLSLRVLDKQMAQLQDTVQALADTQRITTNQFQAGLVSEADVASAQSALKTAEVSLASTQLSRDQLEHAVAVTLGKTPAEFTLPVAEQDPALPSIPAGVPSTLLERRPDIVKAERSMAVANANIGLAESAYFPTLTLNATGGYKSNSFADWIDLPNRVWSIGPSIALTLFDAGLRKAKTDQAIAQYDETVATYRATVLAAFQAVEDNLVAQGRLNEQAALQEEALSAARKAERIVLNQYKAGTVSYLQVLSAQNARLAAENAAWSIRNKQYAASVGLIAAVGGKW
jgi:NodT family efflux transporter outer membrane factor (OMF) lipoprotein